MALKFGIETVTICKTCQIHTIRNIMNKKMYSPAHMYRIDQST